MRGDPNGDEAARRIFNSGVRVGNLGMMLQYSLAMVGSPLFQPELICASIYLCLQLLTVQFEFKSFKFNGVMPMLIGWFGIRQVYSTSQVKQTNGVLS